MTQPINPTFQVNPFVQSTAVVQGTGLVATLSSSIYWRELTGLNISGPAGSIARVYMHSVSNSNKIDSTSRGESNTASYNPPFLLPPGTQVLVEWPNQSSTATCTFFLRNAA